MRHRAFAACCWRRATGAIRSSVSSPAALGYLESDSVLERALLERLAADGQRRGHRHEGFWECMDTYKDAVALNDLWASGTAPWQLSGEGPRRAAAPSGAGERSATTR